MPRRVPCPGYQSQRKAMNTSAHCILVLVSPRKTRQSSTRWNNTHIEKRQSKINLNSRCWSPMASMSFLATMSSSSPMCSRGDTPCLPHEGQLYQGGWLNTIWCACLSRTKGHMLSMTQKMIFPYKMINPVQVVWDHYLLVRKLFYAEGPVFLWLTRGWKTVHIRCPFPTRMTTDLLPLDIWLQG